MQYAHQEDFGGFSRRVLATLIDTVILYIPTTILQRALHEWMYGPVSELQSLALLPQAVGVFVIWAAYEIPFWISPWQATPGKKLCGVVVTTINADRLSLSRAVGRYLCKCLSGAIIIGVLFIPFTRWRQSLHDLMAGTLVPRRRAGEPRKRKKPSVGGFAWALMFLSSGRMPPPPPQSQIEQEAGEKKNREIGRNADSG